MLPIANKNKEEEEEEEEKILLLHRCYSPTLFPRFSFPAAQQYNL